MGRLDPQCERREEIGSDVEEEDLQHPEREGEASPRQRPHHERGQLRHVVREVVGEEPVDVGERRPTLLDGRHDGGEVVVE